jgi:leukotriene-A4 hydrolase
MSLSPVRTSTLLPLIFAAARSDSESSGVPGGPAFADDPHSYAKPAEARVTHVSLDLRPDFSAHRITGTARLSVERAAGATTLILDSRDLTITRVTDGHGAPLTFQLGAVNPILGQSFTISLPAAGDAVVVDYLTSPDAAAVQWLAPVQTAGKRLPFLFTQGESILTRTWIPTQDSPGIRQSYDAVVRVPVELHAVMSAARVGPAGEKDAEGLALYRFKLDQRVPPYLIALAVGDLAFRPIGANTGVYAEPSIVDTAANEFVEVDQMIAAAERLYGPYRWGRYDILVLPPSFPFGGMENPTLTFATPTVLAGDRSLVSLIAHELAHSWSGNLVTNATWNDFWLNEGFTTYIERRIMEELRGKRYADMLLELGRQDLAEAIKTVGGPDAADTRLRLDLTGRDPDEGTTGIAYEKGSAFLQTIESAVGRPRLDAFLRGYFEHFQFQPMTSEQMLAYMRQHLLEDDEATTINVQAWIYEPGLPSNIPPVHSAAFADVDRQIEAWRKGAAPGSLGTRGWSSHEWLHFLRGLPDTIDHARLAELDRTFTLSRTGNSELMFAWLEIAVRNRYEPAFPALERFLTSQGRRKFLRPLYTDLAKTDWGEAMAVRIYKQARPTYHSVSVNAIDQILSQPRPSRG